MKKKILIVSALLIFSKCLGIRPITVGWGVWAVNKTGRDITATIQWQEEEKNKKGVMKWVRGNNVKINVTAAGRKDNKAFKDEGFLPSGSGHRYILWKIGSPENLNNPWYRTVNSYDHPDEIIIWDDGVTYSIKQKKDIKEWHAINTNIFSVEAPTKGEWEAKERELKKEIAAKPAVEAKKVVPVVPVVQKKPVVPAKPGFKQPMVAGHGLPPRQYIEQVDRIQADLDRLPPVVRKEVIEIVDKDITDPIKMRDFIHPFVQNLKQDEKFKHDLDIIFQDIVSHPELVRDIAEERIQAKKPIPDQSKEIKYKFGTISLQITNLLDELFKKRGLSKDRSEEAKLSSLISSLNKIRIIINKANDAFESENPGEDLIKKIETKKLIPENLIKESKPEGEVIINAINEYFENALKLFREIKKIKI